MLPTRPQWITILIQDFLKNIFIIVLISNMGGVGRRYALSECPCINYKEGLKLGLNSLSNSKEHMRVGFQ